MNVNFGITEEEALAILKVEKGADVLDYNLARILRGLQRDGKGDDIKTAVKVVRVACPLITICAVMNPQKSVKDKLPYFGCIATDYGAKLAKAAIAFRDATAAPKKFVPRNRCAHRRLMNANCRVCCRLVKNGKVVK